MIELVAEYAFDDVNFADDWGTQNNLIISLTMWRELSKSRYKRQFELIRIRARVLFSLLRDEIIPDYWGDITNRI